MDRCQLVVQLFTKGWRVSHRTGKCVETVLGGSLGCTNYKIYPLSITPRHSMYGIGTHTDIDPICLGPNAGNYSIHGWSGVACGCVLDFSCRNQCWRSKDGISTAGRLCRRVGGIREGFHHQLHTASPQQAGPTRVRQSFGQRGSGP